MKWIIRIICFAITTAIYIPIERSLFVAETGRPLVWLITAVIYFFVYYIPSRALIAMWNKRKNVAGSASPSNSNQVSKPQESDVRNNEIVYNISIGNGESICIPESEMDNYYASRTDDETVRKSKRLCFYLWGNAMRCVIRIHFPKNYYSLTFFWTVLYCSILDIAQANQVDIMMRHRYNLLLADILPDNPNRSQLYRNLKDFQMKAYSYLSRKDSTPLSSDDIPAVLDFACSAPLLDGVNIIKDLPPITPEMITEICLLIEDTTEYAINLFRPSEEITIENASN